MIDINFLSSTANLYMSQFDVIDKKVAIETTVVTINESIYALKNLKEVLKTNNSSIGTVNLLSLGLSISEITNDIKKINDYLKNYK